MRLLILIFIAVFSIFSAKPAKSQYTDNKWADSVYASLTLEQRIAQLLVIRAYSWKDSIYCDSLLQIVKKYDVGGVCFFKGSPVKQAMLTNRLQQETQTPLLITMDAEWGLGMRLDSAFSFPRQMALGAISEAISGVSPYFFHLSDGADHRKELPAAGNPGQLCPSGRYQ